TAARETRVARVVRHLHHHYTEHIDLESLAEAFYVSRHHLAREFRRSTGTTVITYVNDLRVDQARRLLVETGLPIAQIAAAAGVTTAPHGTPQCRARTRTTPRQGRGARPDSEGR